PPSLRLYTLSLHYALPISPGPRSRPPTVYAFAFEHVDVAADFVGRAAKQEIVLIESGDLLEPLDIAQCQSMVGQRNQLVPPHLLDRKSTRLNSIHRTTSYG